MKKAFWTCLTWHPHEGRARFLRITPASRFAYVDVECRPAGEFRSRVRVTYQIHALTDAGEKWLEAFTGEAYADMIDERRITICDPA